MKLMCVCLSWIKGVVRLQYYIMCVYEYAYCMYNTVRVCVFANFHYLFFIRRLW